MLVALAMTLALSSAADVTLEVGKTVRVGDVDVTFVRHAHATADDGGRNGGMYVFALSSNGGPKETAKLTTRNDDVFAEIDVGGTLVVLRRVNGRTFAVHAVTPAPARASDEECRTLLLTEIERRHLTVGATRSFMTSGGVVNTMMSAAWRGHCGLYTRDVSFFSGSFVQDAGVETHLFAGTSTRVGDVLVTFHGAGPKHSKGGEATTLVYELALGRDGVSTPLAFNLTQGQEHRAELEAHGTALSLRAARDDEVHVGLLAAPARVPLSLEECEGLVRDNAKKTGRKAAMPTSMVNADGIVTVKTPAWTAHCGRYSARVRFEK